MTLLQDLAKEYGLTTSGVRYRRAHGIPLDRAKYNRGGIPASRLRKRYNAQFLPKLDHMKTPEELADKYSLTVAQVRYRIAQCLPMVGFVDCRIAPDGTPNESAAKLLREALAEVRPVPWPRVDDGGLIAERQRADLMGRLDVGQ